MRLKLSNELIPFASIPVYNNRYIFPTLYTREKFKDSNGAFICSEREDEMESLSNRNKELEIPLLLWSRYLGSLKIKGAPAQYLAVRLSPLYN